jgi:hypothetical protein
MDRSFSVDPPLQNLIEICSLISEIKHEVRQKEVTSLLCVHVFHLVWRTREGTNVVSKH